VFAILDVPSDSRDVMRLLGEASPDKWGRLQSVHGLDDGAMSFRSNWIRPKIKLTTRRVSIKKRSISENP
jgi:hypothetical protein